MHKNKEIRNRSLALTNDEFFIISGLIALNFDDPSPYIGEFKKYSKTTNVKDLFFERKYLDKLISVFTLHGSLIGVTSQVAAKIKMMVEFMQADLEYEQKLTKIEETYKNQIIPVVIPVEKVEVK